MQEMNREKSLAGGVGPEEAALPVETYQFTALMKEEIYQMIFAKTTDQASLKKWIEQWLPQVKAWGGMTMPPLQRSMRVMLASHYLGMRNGNIFRLYCR